MEFVERKIFSINYSGKIGYPYRNLMKLFAYLTSHAKVNLRWTMIQNVKYKTIKLLEDNIGEYCHDISTKTF